MPPFHPIVQQTPPSPDQAPTVTTIDRDVVLVAGAGAGKTRTLVARILHLLATGAPVRGIVAVTFTLKAAREMRNRLRHEITRYLAGSRDWTMASARRWQEIYADLDAARIGTIHGLCSELLRSPSRRGRHRPGLSPCLTRRPCCNCAARRSLTRWSGPPRTPPRP
jgi:superfamily I DNA/RNA helicase